VKHAPLRIWEQEVAGSNPVAPTSQKALSDPEGAFCQWHEQVSALVNDSPVLRAYAIRARTSLSVRGRNPGPPQQLL
jgi:hypothetical protein